MKVVLYSFQCLHQGSLCSFKHLHFGNFLKTRTGECKEHYQNQEYSRAMKCQTFNEEGYICYSVMPMLKYQGKEHKNLVMIDQSIYSILLYLYIYSTGSRSRYKYHNVILISQSYLSHMYYDCVSLSIFDECYSIDCALHHTMKSPIVLSMRVKCH